MALPVTAPKALSLRLPLYPLHCCCPQGFLASTSPQATESLFCSGPPTAPTSLSWWPRGPVRSASAAPQVSPPSSSHVWADAQDIFTASQLLYLLVPDRRETLFLQVKLDPSCFLPFDLSHIFSSSSLIPASFVHRPLPPGSQYILSAHFQM